MRVAQPTQTLNSLLCVLILLQQMTNLAMARTHPSSRNHQLYRVKQAAADMPEEEQPPDGPKNVEQCRASMNRNGVKQTATNIAQKAAQEAEHAFSTQQCAAAEVARQVKKQLADRAYAAAKAAEAALSGKQQMVEQLESELCESEAAYQRESTSIENAQNNFNMAFEAAKHAQKLSIALKSLIGVAADNLSSAKAVAVGAQQQIAEKTQLAEAAKKRIEAIKKLLRVANSELQCIKKSAYKAICAASEARQKANRERRHSHNKHKLHKQKRSASN